mgnify:FL=1
MQIFFFVVRYPKYLANIDEDILNKHENIIIDIKKIMKDEGCFITDNPHPTQSSTDAAVKIYELLMKELETSGNGDGESQSSNSGINISNEDPDFGEGENGGLDFGDIIAIFSKILQEISSESEMVDPKDLTIYHSDIEDKVQDFNDFEWKECKENHIDYNEINVWKEENIMRYKSYLREAAPYVTQAQGLIINNKYKQSINTIRFTRNGSLDPTRLANAMCNEQTVYTRRTVETKNIDAEYALVIMLDESGSMNDHGINILATKIAIMLYEAVRNYAKIKLFVYGHGKHIYQNA